MSEEHAQHGSSDDFEFARPYISAVIDRYEGELAVVVVNGEQEIHVPREKLPADAREGMVLRLVISSDQEEYKERELLAKTVLNEILGNSE